MTTVWDFLTGFIGERLASGGFVDWLMLTGLAGIPAMTLFFGSLLVVPDVWRRISGRLNDRNEQIVREREERQ